MSKARRGAGRDGGKAREPAAPPVANLATARFECVYPTCGGICCMNGRPAVEPHEQARIAALLPRALPLLRPEARRRVERGGFLSPKEKEGLPTLETSNGWCVFFNEGCVLHKLGAEEGDRFRFKPWRCVLFPLTRDKRSGEWYVRQRGERGEAWDLFCLDPQESENVAADTLRGEAEHLERALEAGAIPPLAGRKHGRPGGSDRG